MAHGVGIFAQNNPSYVVNVYAHEEERGINPIKLGEPREGQTTVSLLLHDGHYRVIRSVSRQLHAQVGGHVRTKHYYERCLNPFSTKERQKSIDRISSRRRFILRTTGTTCECRSLYMRTSSASHEKSAQSRPATIERGINTTCRRLRLLGKVLRRHPLPADFALPSRHQRRGERMASILFFLRPRLLRICTRGLDRTNASG